MAPPIESFPPSELEQRVLLLQAAAAIRGNKKRPKGPKGPKEKTGEAEAEEAGMGKGKGGKKGFDLKKNCELLEMVQYSCRLEEEGAGGGGEEGGEEESSSSSRSKKIIRCRPVVKLFRRFVCFIYFIFLVFVFGFGFVG